MNVLRYWNNIFDKWKFFQLVSPHLHRNNVTKRGMQILSDISLNVFWVLIYHFICIFGIIFWNNHRDYLISCTYLLEIPFFLAEAQFEGVFDYKEYELYPLGTKTIVHEEPSRRSMWVQHCLGGQRVGGENKHCRCCKICMS